jgi:hypothetical protein
VDLRRASTSWRRIMFTRSWATSGPHTIRIVNLATSGHPRIDVDAFAIVK